jgi:hypothetical protein
LVIGQLGLKSRLEGASKETRERVRRVEAETLPQSEVSVLGTGLGKGVGSMMAYIACMDDVDGMYGCCG